MGNCIDLCVILARWNMHFLDLFLRTMNPMYDSIHDFTQVSNGYPTAFSAAFLRLYRSSNGCNVVDPFVLRQMIGRTNDREKGP